MFNERQEYRELPKTAKSFYEILGVSQTATKEEIKNAFRAFAKELHPDRTGNDPEKAERFKRIKEAYEILWDEEERAKYDRTLQQKASHTTAPAQTGEQETTREMRTRCEAEFKHLIEDEGNSAGFTQALIKARLLKPHEQERVYNDYRELVLNILRRYRISEQEQHTYLTRFNEAHTRTNIFIATFPKPKAAR